MLRCESLTRTFLSGGRELPVLKSITLDVPDGSFVAILGPSGSGKSTLLGLLAGLDRPTAGRVWLDGTELGPLSEDDRARLRGQKVGFVFQSFHLIPTLTARENIQVPLELRGLEAQARADELLSRVGLADRGHHYPAQLSGGEQQRPPPARALRGRAHGQPRRGHGRARDRADVGAQPRGGHHPRARDPRPEPGLARGAHRAPARRRPRLRFRGRLSA